MESLHLFMFLRMVFLLSISNLVVAYSFSSKHPLCHEDESSALLQFKESFVIDKSASGDASAYPKVLSWKINGENSSDCCSWDGIECDEDTGHVIALDLTSSCLYGSINSNSSLFCLSHLRWLSLADNHFNYSQISPNFSHLSRLSYLNLSMSVFSGQIPSEISRLSKLASLDLSGNIYSVDPSTSQGLLELKNPNFRSLVQNLTSLEELHLSWVNISDSVPDTLANVSSLTSLLLRNCELYGEFPSRIFQLPNLQYLSVRFNQDLTGYLPQFNTTGPLKLLKLASTSFSGELPDSMGYLNSLNVLDISYCNFSGSVPSSLGNLAELIQLDMSYNNFSGQIGFWSWLANLTKLVHLDLSHNNLIGGDMAWLGKLRNLSQLKFSANNLSCEIPPSLANLTKLNLLACKSCQLTGEIPYWIMNLNQLTKLDLSYNSLQGPIPRSFSQLVNLQILNLNFNLLSGTLNLDIFLKMSSLEQLQLSANQFTGLVNDSVNAKVPRLRHLELGLCNLTAFPEFLKNQDNLNWLILSANKIQGLLPKWIWNTSTETLYCLDLSHNLLTGFDQPPVVLPWVSLKILDLSSNMLQGSIPVPPPSAFSFSVANNMLTGEIPQLICNVSFLYSLDLSYNNLSGKLPPCLGSFSTSLTALNLRRNKFHGAIPHPFPEGSRLKMIDLGENGLQGKMPRSLANCTMLESLELDNNQISDTFPFWLGSLTHLEVLVLRSNRFHGAIGSPGTDSIFPKLRIIDLSFNDFMGNLPFEYFPNLNSMNYVHGRHSNYLGTNSSYQPMTDSSKHNQYYLNNDLRYSMTFANKGMEMLYAKIPEIFTAIDLSSNNFSGVIPESIGNLKGLNVLNLSHNGLTGRIPSLLGNLTELESMDLSHNKLSGRIPQQLAQLTFLSFFNVSNNHLSGPIPRGKQFGTFENSSFLGNSELCGDPLTRKCNELSSRPAPPIDSDHSKDSAFLTRTDWMVIMMGYGSGVIVGLVAGNMVTTWKHIWFVETFGKRQLKLRGKKKRGRRN